MKQSLVGGGGGGIVSKFFDLNLKYTNQQKIHAILSAG